MITANGGTKVAFHTYYPFGAEATSPNQDSEKLKFTGHERDAASLDYMHARYYAPLWGRFLSPDPLLGDPSRSQSWNRYSYVENNPIDQTDPTGKCGVPGFDPVPCWLLGRVSAGLAHTDVDAVAGRIFWNSGAGHQIHGEITGNNQEVDYGRMLTAHEALSPIILAALMGGGAESDTVDTTLPGEAWVSAEEFGAKIGSRVASQASGKMDTIAADVTAAKMSQSGAATAVDSAVRSTGLRTTGVVKVGDNLVVGSVRVGTSQPVMVVTPQGVVQRATATIEAGRTGVTIKDIRY